MGIEDIISLGVLIMFIVMAGLRKGWEQRKEEERRKQVQRTTIEELPEATRRALYGDPAQIPTARRRGEVGGEVMVEPIPRTTEEGRPLPRPRPRPVAQQRPAPQSRPQAQRQGPPPPPRPARRAPAPVAAEQEGADTEEGPRKTPQQIAAALRTIEQRKKAHAAQKREQMPRSRQQPAAKAQPQAQRQRSPAMPVQEKGFLRGLDDVRRGIVLSEVLGPPVSLR